MRRCPVTCREGCGQPSVPGSRYCEKHKENNSAAAMKKFTDRHSNERPWDKWYDRVQWKNLRHLALAREPICKVCDRNPSTEADHIIPHRGDWALFADLNNIQGLCRQCHSRKTAKEDAGFGNRPVTDN